MVLGLRGLSEMKWNYHWISSILFLIFMIVLLIVQAINLVVYNTKLSDYFGLIIVYTMVIYGVSNVLLWGYNRK
jgi:bacteriorhodopsin